ETAAIGPHCFLECRGRFAEVVGLEVSEPQVELESGHRRIQAQGRFVVLDGKFVLDVAGEGRAACCFRNGFRNCRPQRARGQDKAQDPDGTSNHMSSPILYQEVRNDVNAAWPGGPNILTAVYKPEGAAVLVSSRRPSSASRSLYSTGRVLRPS